MSRNSGRWREADELREAVIARERSLVWLTALVFILGGIIGGGPTSAKLSMFVELPATFLLAIGLAGVIDGHYPRQALPALVFLGLICLVPLIQLIPLPSGYWNGLPGHAVPAAISRLVGFGDLYRPLSLTPEQTQLGVLTLIVPASIFVATLQIGSEGRDQLLKTVVGFAFVSAILGVLQLGAGGGLHLDIYRQVHEGYPIGFFANRNHEGDLLLIALPACAYLIRSMDIRSKTKTWATVGAIMFLSLAVFSTQSRTAVSLLPVALGGTLAVWIGNLRDRRIWIGFGALLVALLICYFVLKLTPLGGHVLERFSSVGDDLRPKIWKNSWAAVSGFWPAGSGVGSFVPVYQMFEDLDSVNSAWVNHAHNDYIEILLETGIVGAVLLVAYVVLAANRLLTDTPRSLHRQRYVVISAITILMAHSLVDYPLRTFALVSIFALVNGMLFLPIEERRALRQGRHPAHPPPGFGADQVEEMGTV